MSTVLRNPSIVNTRRLDGADFELLSALRAAGRNTQAVREAVNGHSRSAVRLAYECLVSEDDRSVEAALLAGQALKYRGLIRFAAGRILERQGWYTSELVGHARDALAALEQSNGEQNGRKFR